MRNVHDDLAIVIDTLEGERDRLASVLDIYFSSIATRSTEATKTLTLLGTMALPALVITGILGMNVAYPAWTRAPWIFDSLVVITLALTIFLVWLLRRGAYLPDTTLLSSKRVKESKQGRRFGW